MTRTDPAGWTSEPDLPAQVDIARSGFDGLSDDGWNMLYRLGQSVQGKDARLTSTLDAILRTALEVVDGVQAASIGLVIGGELLPRASVGGAPLRLHDLQRATRRGPAVDAAHHQQPVLIRDTRSDGRWPDFSELAVKIGVRAVLTTPFRIEAGAAGAVSLYAFSADAFSDVHQRLLTLLGRHAALVLAEVDRAQHLRTMARNRDIIGQAKGVLMARHRVTSEEAFTLLRETSQRSNRKLLKVAEDLVREYDEHIGTGGDALGDG